MQLFLSLIKNILRPDGKVDFALVALLRRVLVRTRIRKNTGQPVWLRARSTFHGSETLLTFNQHLKFEPGTLIVLNDNVQLLQNCMKHSGWRPNPLLPGRYFWDSGFFPYFSTRCLNAKTFEPIDSSISRTRDSFEAGYSKRNYFFSLQQKSDAVFRVDTSWSMNLNFYGVQSLNGLCTESPDVNFEMASLPAAFLLIAPSGTTWQHFILDVLPILAMSAKFLSENSEVPILLLSPSTPIKELDFYFRLLNIPNPIRMVKRNESFNVSKLFYVDARPRFEIYSNFDVPMSYLRCKLNTENRPSSDQKNYLQMVYIKRGAITRNISNETELLQKLTNFGGRNNFRLQILDPMEHSRQEIFSFMKNSQIVLGSHGGSMLNVLGMREGTFLIEFIQSRETDTLYNFASLLGINYFPIAIDAHKHDFDFPVDCDDVLRVVNSCARYWERKSK